MATQNNLMTDSHTIVKSRPHNIALLWGIFFSFTIVTILLTVLVFAPERKLGATPAYYIGLVSHIIFLVTGIRLLKSTFPEFPVFLHPVVVFTGAFIATIMLPSTIAVIENPDNPANTSLTSMNYDLTGLSMASYLTANLCLWFGYIMSNFNLPLTLAEPKLPAKYDRFLICLIFIVIIYLLSSQVAGVTGYGQDKTKLEGSANLIAIFLLSNKLLIVISLIQAQRKIWPRWVAGLAVLLELQMAVFSGVSGETIRIVILLGLTRYATRGVSKRDILIIVAGLLIVTIITIPTQESRRNSLGTASASFLEIYEDVFIHKESEQRDIYDTLKGKIVYRQVTIMFTPNILFETVPSEMEFLGFDQLILFPVHIVPRYFWPGKPNLSKGLWVNQTLLGNSVDSQSAAAISMIGDPYLYWGWPGIIMLFIVFGLFFAWILRIGTVRLPVYIALFIYYWGAAELTTTMLGLTQTLLVFELLYYLLNLCDGSAYSNRKAT